MFGALASWPKARACCVSYRDLSLSSAASKRLMAMSVPTRRLIQRLKRLPSVSARVGTLAPSSASLFSQRAAWRSSASASLSRIAFLLASFSVSASSRYTRALSFSARQFCCSASITCVLIASGVSAIFFSLGTSLRVIACCHAPLREGFASATGRRVLHDEDPRKKAKGKRQKAGGDPPVFCKCSFQGALSPIISQVRILKDLRAHFS